MIDRYMKFHEIKSYNEGIIINKTKIFEEEYDNEYEGIKLWIGQVSNAYSVKLYINNSMDYITVRVGESFELNDIEIKNVKIEIGQTVDDNGSAIVNLILLR